MRQTERADELRLVNGQKSLDSLYLDDELGRDFEVHPVAAFELNAFVADRQGFLTLEAQPAKSELVCQACFVSRLEQSGTEQSMHLDAGTDDHA